MRRQRTAIARMSALVAGVLIAALAAGCGSSRAPLQASPAPDPTASSVSSSSSAGKAGTGAATAPTGSPSVPGETAHSSGPSRPSDSQVVVEAQRLLRGEEEANITSGKVVGATQDKSGAWWFKLDVTEATQGQMKAVIVWNGKGWEETVFGPDIAPEDLPRDVSF